MIKVPGSCGELAQGIFNGRNMLITCPINWYSAVTAKQAKAPAGDKNKNCKSYAAVELLLKRYGQMLPVELQIQSDLPRGKGMASSSADIAASCQAVAKLLGKDLGEDEIKDIALAIEPTDGVFFSGIVAFDHIKGGVRQSLGDPPPIRIAVFDFGGEVDTITFNNNLDLTRIKNEKQLDFNEAYELIKEGLVSANPVLIGKGATISALANQKILPKPQLEKMIIEGNKYGALGVNVAHSGTVAGVLFDKSMLFEYDECVQAVLSACKNVNYLGAADMVPGGIIDEA